MTDPTRLRFELEIEVRATPAQVWDAIATSQGISAWMLQTDIDECEGGSVVFNMGDVSSKGTVTGWDPPRRLAYEETDWAELAGQDGAGTQPLVTEFLVEARSGGTCVVKVVSSAFSTGAEWEQEFFADMAKGWAPSFDVLRLYVEEFPGEPVSSFEVVSNHAISAGQLRAAFDRAGTLGAIEKTGPEHVIIRRPPPAPGFVMLWAMGDSESGSMTRTNGYLYGDGAAEAVDGVKAEIAAWLDEVASS